MKPMLNMKQQIFHRNLINQSQCSTTKRNIEQATLNGKKEIETWKQLSTCCLIDWGNIKNLHETFIALFSNWWMNGRVRNDNFHWSGVMVEDFVQSRDLVNRLDPRYLFAVLFLCEHWSISVFVKNFFSHNQKTSTVIYYSMESFTGYKMVYKILRNNKNFMKLQGTPRGSKGLLGTPKTPKDFRGFQGTEKHQS